MNKVFHKSYEFSAKIYISLRNDKIERRKKKEKMKETSSSLFSLLSFSPSLLLSFSPSLLLSLLSSPSSPFSPS